MRLTSKHASDAGRLLAAPLVVTAGEPAGIGPDLCIALADTEYSSFLVVIGDPQQLRLRAQLLGVEINIREYKAGVNNFLDELAPALCVIPQ